MFPMSPCTGILPDPCLDPDSERIPPVLTSAIPDHSSARSWYPVCPLATDPARLTTFGFVSPCCICVSFGFGLLHCVYVCVVLNKLSCLHAIPE
ncbi:unnamed protein product, partial [Staurois parvus]